MAVPASPRQVPQHRRLDMCNPKDVRDAANGLDLFFSPHDDMRLLLYFDLPETYDEVQIFVNSFEAQPNSAQGNLTFPAELSWRLDGGIHDAYDEIAPAAETVTILTGEDQMSYNRQGYVFTVRGFPGDTFALYGASNAGSIIPVKAVTKVKFRKCCAGRHTVVVGGAAG